MNILLGVTGSVAAGLMPKLVAALKELGEVQVVLTAKADAFVEKTYRRDYSFGQGLISPPEQGEAEGVLGTMVWRDHFDDHTREHPWRKGVPVHHIDLKNWADVLVIAPCTANTLAKITNGNADNMLTNVVRAWPVWKPLILAPAMNTDMWIKPITRRQFRTLSEDYLSFGFVEPQSKVLACGDEGVGAMADIQAIVDQVREQVRWQEPMHYTVYGTSKPWFIPQNPHPGSFGAVRKHDVHTGVDIYTKDGTPLFPMEPGVIVDIVDFTGSKVLDEEGRPMSWWNDTKAVLVKGISGVLVYGEIEPLPELRIGQAVGPKDCLGNVKAVLPPEKLRKDIPHHSTAMLHIELYTNEAAEKNFRWGTWTVNGPRPEGLLDPTPQLLMLTGTSIVLGDDGDDDREEDVTETGSGKRDFLEDLLASIF